MIAIKNITYLNTNPTNKMNIVMLWRVITYIDFFNIM